MIKKYALLQIITAFIVLLSFKLALAAIPPTLNYQGHLTDSSGAPVDGPVNMVFAIYDVEAGGTALWSDSLSVIVNQGVFSVELGDVSPLPPGLFELPLWVGLTVDTDAEMAPRRAISSVGFSFKAGDANRLEGISAATLDQSAHVGDSANPHSVTATQVGAVTSVDISTHAGDASAHHTKTDSFPELSGQIADVQIPALIARDAEVMPIVLSNDGPGSGLNADMLDGLHSSDFMPVFADNWVNTTGDTMTGNLTTTAKIGIGTAVPIYSLDVRDGTNNYLGYFSNDNNGSGGAYGTYTSADARGTGTGFAYGATNYAFSGSTSGSAYSSRNYSYAYGSSPSYAVFAVADGGTTTGNEYAFYGLGKGYFSDNLGLGTISPDFKLDVRGDASTYLGYFNNTSTASSAYGIFSQAYAYNNASAIAYAGDFLSVGGNTGGTTYGINSTARAYGTSTAYGVYSNATAGTTTGNEYALYGVGKGFFSQDLDVDGTVKMGYERITGVAVDLNVTGSCSIVNSGTCYYNSASVACPTGKVVMGGGCHCSSVNCYIVDSYMNSASTYYCMATGSSSLITVTPHITCARMGD